jgi:vacuole morphology and inheritance protein 14
MLLPQSSAFLALRTRLNAVNSAGFLHISPKSYVLLIYQHFLYITSVRNVGGAVSTRSKLGRDEIKWQDLLYHFRSVQLKHEKARRQALGADTTSFSLSEYDSEERSNRSSSSRPGVRKVTGDINITPPPLNTTPAPPYSPKGGILSPLNPRSRGYSGSGNGGSSANAANNIPANPAAALAQQVQRPKRSALLGKRP